eukprot:CAMPEP_0177786488 /NCGR_PEP_ID=MMETSP0491_2-20121128/20955_1 /TAXON_ID=63592 /ORGANISM="Tetraselmis chuii, Strain PLY429" /LENGTH=153 /DNA_ID=CAMNT_0019307713 /DNA_START=97 /DNA_END=555 /DNA_ORIENTATION=-
MLNTTHTTNTYSLPHVASKLKQSPKDAVPEAQPRGALKSTCVHQPPQKWDGLGNLRRSKRQSTRSAVAVSAHECPVLPLLTRLEQERETAGWGVWEKGEAEVGGWGGVQDLMDSRGAACRGRGMGSVLAVCRAGKAVEVPPARMPAGRGPAPR